MSFWNLLFRRTEPPTIFLGDVLMHLEWNLLSAISDGFHYTWAQKPSPEVLKEHFAASLGLPLFSQDEMEFRPGDKLFHFAITDLRHGQMGIIGGADVFLPFMLRPSVTLQGYLIDIDTGVVLAEAQVTRKPGWLRYRNPRILGPMVLSQFVPLAFSPSDPAGRAMQPPLCEAAAITVLQKLMKSAKISAARKKA